MISSTHDASRQNVTAPLVGIVFVVLGALLVIVGYVAFAGSCGGGQAVVLYGVAILMFGIAAVFFGGPQALFAAGGAGAVIIVYGLVLMSAAACSI